MGKRLKPLEIRICLRCPACGKKMWGANFVGKKSDYIQCVWCRNRVHWKLVVKENK